MYIHRILCKFLCLLLLFLACLQTYAKQILSPSDSAKLFSQLKSLSPGGDSVLFDKDPSVTRVKSIIESFSTEKKIFSYQALGYKLAKLNMSTLAQEAYNRAILLIPKNDNRQRARIKYIKASVLFHYMHKDEIIALLNDALKEKPRKGGETEALIYSQRGRAHYENGDYKKAMADYLYAKKYYDENHIRNENLGFLYHFIGSVFKRQNSDKEALRYYNKIIDLGKEINSKILEAEGSYLSAEMYSLMGDSLKDLELSLRALNIYKELRQHAMEQMMLGNIAHYYFHQKQFELAKQYLDSSLALQKIHPNHENMATIWRLYAKYYSKRGKYKKAIELIDKALDEAENSKSKRLLLLGEVYHTEAWIHYEHGHYKDAFESLDDFQYYNEQLINEENSRIIHDLEARYQNEKKKKEIELLNKDKKLNELALKSANQRNLFLILGLIMAGAFLLIMINRYQFIRHQKKIIEKEKQRSDELLLNILPEEVAEELKNTGHAEAKLIDEVTVLFTDFKGFTAHSADLSPTQLVSEINECFVAFDKIMEKYGIEKIKTIGDSYMAAGGLPTPNQTHIEDVVNAALEIQNYMAEMYKKKTANGDSFFETRIGVHTGPVVAGIVGIKKFAYDIWGDTVNTASRMESNGEAGKVNISENTYNLLKGNPEYSFQSRGKITAKGKGELEMYFISKSTKKENNAV